MDDKIFEVVFNNLNKGKDLERDKKYEEALMLYFENLRYQPEGMDYYERPCIVLERLKRYEEAIDICEQAIAMIEVGKFNGDILAFQKRLKRLKKKNGDISDAYVEEQSDRRMREDKEEKHSFETENKRENVAVDNSQVRTSGTGVEVLSFIGILLIILGLVFIWLYPIGVVETIKVTFVGVIMLIAGVCIACFIKTKK